MKLAQTSASGIRDGHEDLVCHCRRVTYGTVDEAIHAGRATSLADVQRATTACTRCFGCRFEIERMLEGALGDAYVRAPFLTRPEEDPTLAVRGPGGATTGIPKRMYMPVLHGAGGSTVRTRVVVFFWHEGADRPAPIELRADLLRLNGTRLGVSNAVVAPGQSAVIEVGEMDGADRLSGGIGTLKIVVEAERVGSLRPYFQFVSRGGVTSTHEKSSPRKETAKTHNRSYYWVFPVGAGPDPSQAFYYAVNATTLPISGRELVWHGVDGEESRAPVPDLELDQGVMAPLHELFPSVGAGGHAGTVRLSPSAHVAGHIIRFDPRTDRWRVQHL